MRSIWTSPGRRAALSAGAALLVISACTVSTGAGPPGRVEGRAILAGRVPGGGRPLQIGAVHAGQVLGTASIRPGGRFTFTVPPGTSKIALWLPGARPAVSNAICAVKVMVSAGQATAANLECEWL